MENRKFKILGKGVLLSLTSLEMLKRCAGVRNVNYKRALSILFLTGSIFCLVFPILTFAQKNIMGPPGDLEEMKEMGESFKEETEQKALGIFARIWKEEVAPVWQKMWNCSSNWWNNSFVPFIKGVFGKIGDFFIGKIKPSVEEEFEKRKSVVEDEFQKEKEELKKEAPETGRSLWKKFKDIIK